MLRMAKCLTQKELADMIGMQQSTIARFEAGSVAPSLNSVKRLAEALECDIGALAEYPVPVQEDQRQFLMPDEARMVDLFRACNMQQKRILMETAEAFVMTNIGVKHDSE